MNLVLVGFMGAGKTTVGRLVAERLGLAFVDVDAELERRAGRSIAAIFAADGEAGFRAREAELIAEVARGVGQLIAAGGGALLRPESRAALEAGGVLVCLRARAEEIARRLGEAAERPLLAADPSGERVAALLAERQALYDTVRLQVETTGRTPAQVADEVVELWQSERHAG